MAIVKEAYSATRVNLIYQLLKSEADNGQPKQYDIRVDDLKVISRTADPERFYDHEDFVLGDTRGITINIYDGASNRCTRYYLLLKDEAPGKQELSGIEKTIHGQIAQERMKWEYEQLKKAYAEQGQQLQEAEQYHKDLGNVISELEAEKNSRPNKITEAIVGLASMYMAKNPNALNGIPILGGLFGGGKANELSGGESQPGTTEPVGEASFSKAETLEYTGKITEADNKRFFKALIPLFPEEHRQKVADINKFLFLNHQIIDEVHGLLMDTAAKQNEEQEAA